ncbi:HET-domain-containing protein [Colletotrichum somersetense]|nr:HET-domain-containing protein [Colletotrichum somersetense]
MRLINVETLDLLEFFGASIPPYAILSHTWGKEEVTFQDWQDPGRRTRKAGFAKIEGARRQARRNGFKWLWVDTNCIDKSSSAELSEAINSMFAWYQRAGICYAYLEDIVTAGTEEGRLMSPLGSSRWFTRGWTLQELLAPQNVHFYDQNWKRIGSRNNALVKQIEAVTGIESDYLIGKITVKNASIAKKMCWVSRRTTTREEDMAYCMLGLFDINMPLLYGEGAKAFVRLQEEIIKVSTDHTLFCWQWRPSTPRDWASLLAPSPSAFINTRRVVQMTTQLHPYGTSKRNQEISTYLMTNAGLSIRLPVLYTWSGYLVALEAIPEHGTDTRVKELTQYWLLLYGDQRADQLYLQRQAVPMGPVILDHSLQQFANRRSIIVRKEKSKGTSTNQISWGLTPEDLQQQTGKLFGCFFVFHSNKLRNRWLRDNAPRSYIRSDFVWLKNRKKSMSRGTRTPASFEVGYQFMTNVFQGQEGGSRPGQKWGSLFLAVRTTNFSNDAAWFARIITHTWPLKGVKEQPKLEELLRWVLSSQNEQHSQVSVDLNLRLRLGQSEMVDVHGARARLLLLSEVLTKPETDLDDVASNDSREVVFPKVSSGM